MTLADENGLVTGEEPGRPDDHSFDAENAGAQKRDRPAEIPVDPGRAVVGVGQIRVCRERPADRRDEVPLGVGNGWKCEREQYPCCKTRQKTRRHYVTSLRKSVAKRDFVTLPAGSWKVALKPSLFARRMKVIF